MSNLPLIHPFPNSSLIAPTAPGISRAGRELGSLQWHRRLGLKRVDTHLKAQSRWGLSCPVCPPESPSPLQNTGGEISRIQAPESLMPPTDWTVTPFPLVPPGKVQICSYLGSKESTVETGLFPTTLRRLTVPEGLF